MLKIKEMEINDIITKAGSKFIILDLFNNIYLCEQLIDGVHASFEVGNLINVKIFGKEEKHLTIASPSKFGFGKFDKSFSCKKDSELQAREYFNKCKLLQI